MRIAVILFVSAFTTFIALTTWAAPVAGASLNGKWRYDPAQSVTEAPRQGGRSIFGNMKPTIIVQGIPVPLPGSNDEDDSQSRSTPKNPDVLFCQSMTIEDDDDRKRITFDRLGVREYVPGKHRGRTTRLSPNRLVESYKTTSRSVSEAYVLEAENRLVVTVTINPKGDKKTVYKRIFYREGTRELAPSAEDAHFTAQADAL